MTENENASPLAFRHDSMLRITQQHESNPSSSPPKRPRIDLSESSRSKPSQRARVNGTAILKSGSLSGVEYALLSVTEPIVLSGCAWLSVLRRGVHIFGQTVNREHHPIFAVSAPFAPLVLRLSPCDPHEAETTTMEQVNPQRGLGPAALIHKQIRDSLESTDVANAKASVVLITSCPKEEHVWRQADGYREADDIAYSLSETLQHLSIPNFDSFAPVVSSLRISRSADNLTIFEEWANWHEYCRELDEFLAEHRKSDLRVLVLGVGGSGKSTFVRCISNYLTTFCGGLVMMETDVGQPELNLPGLVAAHHVSEHHVGSALGHVRGVPIAARLLGETTPRDNPDLYEACLETVAEIGLSYSVRQDLPVVVNTDGWVSGAGSALLDTVLTQMRPSHAVCMFTGRGPTSATNSISRSVIPNMKVSYVQRPLGERKSLYTRSVARELQIAAYFSKELVIGRVRAIAIEKLSVYAEGKKMADVERALLIMNGSIVAIASSNKASSIQLAAANVVGYGLVRGVALETRMAYISSPVPSAVLKRSNAIVLCEHIHVPNAVMLAMASKSSNVNASPFLLRDHADGSHHMHSRSSLQRRTTNVTEL